MKSAREGFFQRVRDALATCRRPGSNGQPPSRGAEGYQGAGIDPADTFLDRVKLGDGRAYHAPTHERAVNLVLDLVQAARAKRVLVGKEPLIETLELRKHVLNRGAKVESPDQLTVADSRDTFFGCDLAISGVDYAIAETGSLVMLASKQSPRSLSLLPPIHIALVERSQIVADLFDLFEGLLSANVQRMPSCVSLITGPSKTGDIELRLVTGVHGPGELHIVRVGD
jgi:L-lactate utilization protein LutC